MAESVSPMILSTVERSQIVARPARGRKRVVFVLESITRTGGVLVIMAIAEALAQSGGDIHVISKSSRSEAVEACGSCLTHISYHSLSGARLARRATGRMPVLRGLEFRVFASETYELLRRFKPALCIATEHTTAFPVAAYARSGHGRAIYYAQHDEALTNQTEGRSPDRAEASYALGLQMIANSSWLRKRLATRGCSVIKVVFPSIDLAVFQPGSGRPNNDAVHIVSLVKPGWVKGLDIARDAILEARNRCALPIVWHGYGTLAVPHEFASLPNTVHHGVLTSVELAALLQRSTVALSTSRLESFPLPPLEAMATGTPIITAQIGTEDYAYDKQNSRVIGDDAAASYARAIVDVVSDENGRRRIAAAGSATAKAFTWNAHFASVREALDI